MNSIRNAARRAAVMGTLVALAACQSAGGLGSILGSVLGGGGGQQLSGTIQVVDTRSQVISINQSNGQNVSVGYDANTRVVYQNQNYPVTSLERGDQVTARIQDAGNGNYYTDSVQVVQPVNGSNGTNNGTSNGNVQSLTGTVRQVNTQNGYFTIDMGNGTLVTVSMPYNPTRADQNRFQSLRNGDNVRFYGVYLNNSRVELRQFY
ncbi:MAG: hypothetical protein JWO05_801 [Gemmatimonadetes bacterium]|nr:hypothetical protein [Gemmatimonadota bacterium]